MNRSILDHRYVFQYLPVLGRCAVQPAAPPLPIIPITFSSSLHCSPTGALFACMLITDITGICMLSQKTPSFFTLCQGTTPRPMLPVVQRLSGVSSPSGGPKLALPESLHSSHHVMFPLGHSSPHKTMGSPQPLLLSVVEDSGALTHVAKALLWEI